MSIPCPQPDWLAAADDARSGFAQRDWAQIATSTTLLLVAAPLHLFVLAPLAGLWPIATAVLLITGIAGLARGLRRL